MRLTVGSDQACLVGDDDELSPVARPQLSHGMADVSARGGRAEEELVADLVVAHASRHQREDLALASGQYGEPVLAGLCGGSFGGDLGD